jgi:hypothetical protein
MADIGQAYVQIIPKAEGISGQITNVLSGEAGDAGTKVGGLFTKGFGGKLAKGAAIAGTALAAGLAVGGHALKQGIKDTAAYGDNVDKMSQKIGFSAEEYQKWDYVLQRAGTDIGKMAPAMKTLSSAAASNSTAFQQLGISQEQVAKMSQGELFSKTIEQLSSMEDKTKRTALASQLLGRGATELGPLLNGGTDAIREQMEIAEKYGMVMSDAAVKASADFTDSVTTMQMTMTGLKNRMMAEFLPAATQITDGIGKMFAGDMSGVDDIVAGIEGIASKVGEMAPKILKAGADLIGQLIEGLMSKSGDIGQKAGELATTIVSKLIEKAPDILKSGLQLILGLAQGLISGLPRIVSAIGRIGLSIVRGLGSAIWGKVKAAANGIKDRFLAPINTLRDKIKGIVDKIKGFFSFKIKAPHVPLPHFSISPAGWKIGDLLKGTRPSLSVRWYKKAEEDPYMFGNATLFGAGERNDEILYGRAALMKDIKEATQGSGEGDIIINLNYTASDDANDMVRDIARNVKLYKMAGAL